MLISTKLVCENWIQHVKEALNTKPGTYCMLKAIGLSGTGMIEV